MTSEQLRLYSISPDRVGIVTTFDGIPIQEGEIAGTIIPDHDNFKILKNSLTGVDGEACRNKFSCLVLGT
jgi:hypothetical protein